MGRMLSCTWLRKGCELLPGHGRAQGWQMLTLIQLQKLSGSQAAAMRPGGDAREETTPALLVFTPLSLLSSKKNPLWSFHVPSLWISKLLFQGSAGASFTGHTWDHVLVPPHWEGGSCPSLSPLLTWEGTARHEVPQDQIFLHPGGFLGFLALPFSSAPAGWLCGQSLVLQDLLRSTWGFPHRQSHGFMTQRKCKHLYPVHFTWVGTSSIPHLPHLSWITQSI